jgi:hypothetical protein
MVVSRLRRSLPTVAREGAIYPTFTLLCSYVVLAFAENNVSLPEELF